MSLQTCPTCGRDGWPGEVPPEPPVGTWVRDRFGGLSRRGTSGGWGLPGFFSTASWDAMWKARGPLVECPVWGVEVSNGGA